MSPSGLTFDAVQRLPKILLHDHLDSSIRPSTMIELAQEAGHELPADSPEKLRAAFRENANSGSLVKYLEVFDHITAVLQSRDALHRLGQEYVETLVEDGVVYAEPRWAPEQHLQGGLSLVEAVEAVQEGIDEGIRQAEAVGHTVVVDQLLCAMRMNDRAEEVADIVIEKHRRGVVGFDIAGPEDGFLPSRFRETFTRLTEALVPVTVHAGEAAGVESIREAVTAGRAHRLGHGIRVAEDIQSTELGEVARWVLERQIHLETSPTSNVHTGAVAAVTGKPHNVMSEHPFDALYRMGFNVGVNTDNRVVSDVTLTGELMELAEAFDYTATDLLTFQLNALEAGFASHEDKQRLREHVITSWSSSASPLANSSGTRTA
ncbi:adenosine deaminase [Nesterenkonia populi]